MGGADLPITPEDRAELDALGWFISEDAWSCVLWGGSMNNGNFIRGVIIFARYLDPEQCNVYGADRQVYMGSGDMPITPEDRQALLDLDWFIDVETQSWSCFTWTTRLFSRPSPKEGHPPGRRRRRRRWNDGNDEGIRPSR
jgi:hypothetical protein